MRKRRLFISATGERFSVKGQLPKYSRVGYQIPDLAEQPRELLSEDEALLARYMHIRLPKKFDPMEYLAAIEEWECVEEVQPPRDVQPAEEVQPPSDVQPVEEVQPPSDVQPAEEIQPSHDVQPAEGMELD
jgi:hypothetical protein